MEQYKPHLSTLIFLVLLVFSAGAAAQFAFYKVMVESQAISDPPPGSRSALNMEEGKFLLCHRSLTKNGKVSCQFLSSEFLPNDKCDKHIEKELVEVEKRTGLLFPRTEGDCDRAYRDPRFNSFKLTGWPIEMNEITLKPL